MVREWIWGLMDRPSTPCQTIRFSLISMDWTGTFPEFGVKVAVLRPAARLIGECHFDTKYLAPTSVSFGVNFRADVATIMRIYHPSNGYQACVADNFYQWGYRHWGDLMKVGWMTADPVIPFG